MERGSLPPLVLGLIDFAIGLLLSLALGCALVAGLHLVDALSLSAGAGQLIDVQARLRALGEHPADPGNWWIYATLFSTLLPSFANAVIGCVSLVAANLPAWSRRWMVKRINRLAAKDGAAQVTLQIKLAAPAAVGTFAAMVLLWVGTVALIAWSAPVLRIFHAVVSGVDWVLWKTFGM
jgi:hypothetical protein